MFQRLILLAEIFSRLQLAPLGQRSPESYSWICGEAWKFLNRCFHPPATTLTFGDANSAVSSILPVLVMFSCVNDCHWQTKLVGSLWKLDSVYKWARSSFCRHVSTVDSIPLNIIRLYRAGGNYISTNVKSAHLNANSFPAIPPHTFTAHTTFFSGAWVSVIICSVFILSAALPSLSLSPLQQCLRTENTS